jgi:hypothetical protein
MFHVSTLLPYLKDSKQQVKHLLKFTPRLNSRSKKFKKKARKKASHRQ